MIYVKLHEARLHYVCMQCGLVMDDVADYAELIGVANGDKAMLCEECQEAVEHSIAGRFRKDGSQRLVVCHRHMTISLDCCPECQPLKGRGERGKNVFIVRV